MTNAYSLDVTLRVAGVREGSVLYVVGGHYYHKREDEPGVCNAYNLGSMSFSHLRSTIRYLFNYLVALMNSHAIALQKEINGIV